MKKIVYLLVILVLITFYGCGDPGQSYIDDGEYQKAANAYRIAISDDFAKTDIIKNYCGLAISYSKMGNAGRAWGAWTMAKNLLNQIQRKNSNRREVAKIVGVTAKTVKFNLANYQQNRNERLRAQYEKIKPKIYKNAMTLYSRKLWIASLREFNKIPKYKNSAGMIRVLRGKVKGIINRLWQQGFALFSEDSYARAIRVFDQILAVEPSHRNAKIYRAKAKAKLKRLQQF